ncbi:MAG: nicotinate (nicotinamide) nucleotide adenylyltransferase [Clostridia bacterium]
MKIGFFGGSFNPPTLAHLNIAEASLNQANIDKFFFVPVGNTYKKPELIDEKYRYEMLEIMCNNEKNVFVENIEMNQKNNISTIEAFEMIEEKYKKLYENIEIYYIMGADNFIKLPNWNDAEKLVQKKYIIFKRNDLNLEKFIEENKLLKNYGKNFKILELNKNKDYRSGIIRDLVKKEDFEEAKKYTKAEIIAYIKERNIYK